MPPTTTISTAPCFSYTRVYRGRGGIRTPIGPRLGPLGPFWFGPRYRQIQPYYHHHHHYCYYHHCSYYYNYRSSPYYY